MNKNIHTRIDETLNSFSGMQKAEAKPFFITRVNARLDKRLETKSTTFIFYKPVFAIGILLLCIVMNIVLLNTSNNSKTENISANNASLEAFSNTYNLNTQSPY